MYFSLRSFSLRPRDARGITVLSLLLLIIAIVALAVALFYFWPVSQAVETALRSGDGSAPAGTIT